MKVFLGIFPPSDVVDDIRIFKQQLRKQKQNLRFVPAPEVHLTLKFLGTRVTKASADLVKDVLGNVLKDQKQFNITIKDVRFGMPQDTKSRLLIAEIEESPELAILVELIEEELARKNLKDIYPRRRKFTPHITLARIHGNIHKKKIREIEAGINSVIFGAKGKTLTVDSLKLINSEPVKGGQVYRMIKEYSLSK